MKKTPNEAIDITISVLRTVPNIHYKACYEDITGRPTFDCVCPIKDIVDDLLIFKQRQNRNNDDTK